MPAKNILMIIPNLDFGGAQRSFRSLANGLHDQHQVYVCVFNTLSGVPYSFDPQIIDLDIPGGSNWTAKMFRFYQRWRKVRQLKRDLAIHTTISYLEGANYINVLSRSGDNIVISVRGSQYHDETIGGLLGWFRKNLLIPFLYRRAHHLVALNRGISRELIQGMGLPADKVKVIRNFYDISHLETQASESLEPQFEHLFQGRTVIYAGRLAVGKGVRRILDVFQQLQSICPRCKLVLVGDGPQQAQLITYARKGNARVVQGLKNPERMQDADIIFLGYQQNPYKFISRADVMLIASSSEGGPNILYESIICGTLVISADCPYGPKEVLAPQLKHQIVDGVHVGDHGILLPLLDQGSKPQHFELWAQVVSEYLNDGDSRHIIEQRARSWVHKYSQERILAKWQKVI